MKPSKTIAILIAPLALIILLAATVEPIVGPENDFFKLFKAKASAAAARTVLGITTNGMGAWSVNGDGKLETSFSVVAPMVLPPTNTDLRIGPTDTGKILYLLSKGTAWALDDAGNLFPNQHNTVSLGMPNIAPKIIGSTFASGSIPGITTSFTNLISGVRTQRISYVNGLITTNELISW